MNIDLPLDRRDRAALRKASKTIYGHMHVMEAVIVIGQASVDRFYQAGLAAAVGCNPNQAGRVIEKLVELGVVEAVPREEGQSRDYHRRLPSVFWETTITYAEEILQRLSSADVAHLADRR